MVVSGADLSRGPRPPRSRERSRTYLDFHARTGRDVRVGSRSSSIDDALVSVTARGSRAGGADATRTTLAASPVPGHGVSGARGHDMRHILVLLIAGCSPVGIPENAEVVGRIDAGA